MKKILNNKRRFTKLEIILFCFVTLSIIGFFIFNKSSNFNVLNFIDKKTALQQRYDRLNYLIDNHQVGQYYDEFVPQSLKAKKSRDDFISEAGNKETPKHTIVINSVSIKDTIGYIDRTVTECTDENCTNKIEKRIYKKWEFKEGNWYPVGEEYCTRDTPYGIPPEFERAISLLKQREDQRNQRAGEESADWKWLNCVDIQYSSIPDAEGYFTFDQNSTAERLTIFIDISYKIKDDLLTAFLLSHELNHALNFLISLENGTKQDCYDAEILAFVSQLNFFTFGMNSEEQSSLIYRIPTLQVNENSPIQLIRTFGDITTYTLSRCSVHDTKCVNNLIGEQLSQMVKSNAYYQKQCGAN